MIIRSAFGRRLDFSQGLNRIRVGARWRRLMAAVAVSLLPGLVLAQIPSGPVTSQSSEPTSALTPAVSARLPNTGVSAPAGYTLIPNDEVAVEVYGENDLHTNARLNGEGNLSVPLLGSIHLAGLTLPQAASKLTELYGRDYLVNPKVNVTLIGYAKRRFSVLGQVSHPGSFEMPDESPAGIDLLEAIAMAGGYTRIAAPERVTVRRHKATGGDEIIKVNAKRMVKGSGGSFRVEPGDTVTVGESIF